MSKIISISGQKGGCGKTTVTIIMASTLAYKYGKKVLVIDADTNQHSIQKSRLVDVDSIKPYKTGEKDEAGNDKLEVKNWDIYNAFKAAKTKPYPIVEATLDVKEIVPILEKYSDEYDYIFLDLPGNLDNANYFKVIRNADVVFIPFIVDPLDFDSNFPFAKVLYNQLLNTDQSRIQHMYYFWNKFEPDVRKAMFENMQDILHTEMPDMVELDNKMLFSRATTNSKLRNTLVAPIGKFGEFGNVGITVDEMCKKVF